MAFCLSEHAWTANELDSSTKLVFISLCRRANIKTLQCWPSVSTIAAECSLSERTVRDCIKKLADKSKPYITYRKRGMRSNVYTITYLPPNLATDKELVATDDQSVFSKAMGLLGKAANAVHYPTAAVPPETPANSAAQVRQILPTEPVIEPVKEIPIQLPPPSTVPSSTATTPNQTRCHAFGAACCSGG